MSGVRTGYVETPSRPVNVFAPTASVTGWSTVTGAWSLVTLQARSFPKQVQWLPQRFPANAGETVALPTPEATALIDAGYAVAATGSVTQEGNGP